MWNGARGAAGGGGADKTSAGAGAAEAISHAASPVLPRVSPNGDGGLGFAGLGRGLELG